MSLLAARDLSVIPPGAREPAVSDVTLDVAAGEWLAITGGNGGGKTSLLLGLAGLWPCAGDLRLDGDALDPRSRSGMAVILQDPSTQILQPTVRDELAFGLRNQGLEANEVERRVLEWSAAFGLEGDLDRDPVRLSAGRQQSVLLAAALAIGPSLLLADEPTAHLDARSRRAALGRIEARVREGMAVVWVTQLDEELALATRTLHIGSPIGSVPKPSPRILAGSARLRVRVEPAATASDPRVWIDLPLEIEIPSRGVTGLVGRNGVGKSAILGAVAGHTPIPQVTVSWLAPPEPPPIATLQYPELQIFEEDPSAEVTYAATSRGVDLTEALEAATRSLESLGMSPESWRARRTWTLSTGEKRILEIVSALIAPAALYVLDEPTAGLDPARRAALAGMISTLAESRPVLAASQDREWLEDVGSNVVDLDLPS
jgi:energy-coupling factor transport system ATP-binding protein